MKRRVYALPTPQLVRSIIRYDGTNFYWVSQPLEMFANEKSWAAWNRLHAGQMVKVKRQTNGYNGVRIHRALIMVHRLIWVLHHGQWPKFEIDHINGDHTDNRIENLRDVPKSINMRNQKRRSDNTSGMPGVCWCAERRKWRVNIGTTARRVYVGQFARQEDAIAARKAAQAQYGFTARHGSQAQQAAA